MATKVHRQVLKVSGCKADRDMLRGLDIRDMLIIDHLSLEFSSGLNVLTGETGAGKSILLDSLGLFWAGGPRGSGAQRSRSGRGKRMVRSWSMPSRTRCLARGGHSH